jgi:hypothetical protein
MEHLGRTLLVLGLFLVVAGGLVWGLGRVGALGDWIGHLPGDIRYEGENVRVYVPIGTMIVVSLVLTVLINLAMRLWR